MDKRPFGIFNSERSLKLKKIHGTVAGIPEGRYYNPVP
jgi:hypothetical protein